MNTIKKINESNNIGEVLLKLSISEIEKIIRLSADAYYNSSISLLSDANYDALVERLKFLSPNSPVLKQIGAPIKGKKVKLPYWMGSMDKVKSDQKLIDKWKKTYHGPYIISDKLDGISCLLEFKNGEIGLYTRGDGQVGQNISHLVDLINMQLDNLTEDTVIRGELIMAKNKFKKYAGEMANARNMVAGIVNSKPESVDGKRAKDVDFVAYETIVPNIEPSSQFEFLENQGLLTAPYDIYKDISVDILDTILQKRKAKSVYEIDGIIVTEDKLHQRNKSGNPQYSFAYKGATETAEVKVVNIIWKPSKDGYIVPRIQFEPVRLSQADLEYTTGFNANFISENMIGPGAIITMVRSGDVIPYILGVVKPAKKLTFPTDLDWHWDDNHVNIVLDDPDSDNTVIIQRLTRFVKYIGVDNMSEGLITKLVNAGYDSIIKLISITEEELLEIEGFQKRLAEKIYNNLLEALSKVDLLTLMAGSNEFGRGFGVRKIKKILDTYPNIVDSYTKATRDNWHQKLNDIDGFDDISTDSFLDSLPSFQKLYKVLKSKIKIKPHKNVVVANGKFAGEIVVFTGFRNADWQKYIETQGGKVSLGVSSNTTLLVYADGEETSAKYQKAKKLGIKTINKTAFAKKYNI